MDTNLNENERLETLGEYRVGCSFNPSSNEDVLAIKNVTAILIDALDAFDFKDGEKNRLLSLARTDYESAAMWAVKAVTKSERHKVKKHNENSGNEGHK